MVSRCGGRKEPTMHCFVSHCGHPQPQHHAQHAPPPPSLSQFRIISAANAGRPDVSFHVAATPFPPQQGGGAAPPGGPQLRGLHHPHHAANQPLPSAHQQPPPQPSQSQHSGGPPGPAPTSTPPGPTDMGKQGPHHLQGQPQGIPQGGQMSLSYGVPNQTRPNTSQPYYAGPRGPAPQRMPNHRGQVVNMPANNVGQQIYSHVSLPPVPMYSVPPMNQGQMFVPTGPMQMYSAGSRHQGSGANYFPQPAGSQQLMMQHQLQYPSFQTSPQFFYQGLRGASMAGAPGGVGPGLTGGASQPVVVPGAPQLGQSGQVSMIPLTGGNVLGVPGLPGDSGSQSGPVSNSSSSTGSKNQRRKHALDIVDPKTMKHVDIYESSGGSTPPRSGDSSARETPQPSSGSGQMDVVADFAARVAKAASENSNGPPAPQVPFSEPSSAGAPPDLNVNGPEHVSLNSIASTSDCVLNQSDTSLSKPPVVVIDDQISSWKQVPSKASCIGNKINSKNEANLIKMEDQGPLYLEADNLVKQDHERERSVPPGVPSVSVKDMAAPQPDLPVAPPRMGQPVFPVGIVKDHTPSVLADPNLTPVVSAITNSPDIELVHHRPNSRDQYPGLKSSTSSHSSPRRKARAPESVPVDKIVSSSSSPSVSSIPPVTASPATSCLPPSSSVEVKPQPQPQPQREHAPNMVAAPAEPKLSPSLPPAKKTIPTLEQPVSKVSEESVFVAPAPKERREEKVSRARDRSSQGKESEKAREKSQGGEREKPAQRNRDISTTSASAASSSPVTVSSTESSASQRGTKASPSVTPHEEPVTKHQTNGETTDYAEGKSSQQRNKHKRNQKRELNRKGAEKEGTEMDAFAEPSAPTIPSTTDSSPPVTAPHASVAVASPVPQTSSPTPSVAAASVSNPLTSSVSTALQSPEFQTAPQTVASSPVVSANSIPTTATSSSPSQTNPLSVPIKQSIATIPANSNSVVPSDNKMADNVEVKNDSQLEKEKENEAKLVAARNEENAKVSNVNSEKSPLIKQSATTKVGVSKYNSKEGVKGGQWSPDNQDGEKKYEREFLMSLKNEPLSKVKPKIQPDLEIVLKDPRPLRSLEITRGSHDTFTPKFMNNQGPSRGGVAPKRLSQQGKAKGGKPQGVIHLTLSLKEEVKLRETENAWKPGRMKPSDVVLDAKTEELYKKVRGVLNKLTPQKFNTLVGQVRSLPIDTKDKLQGVIDLVFDKAIDEPGFSVAYAEMCKLLSNIEVPDESRKEDGKQESVFFRKLIVMRCQQEFEKNNEAELNKEQRLKEIANTTDPEKKKEMLLHFEEESRRLRMKSVGNIRFIGELFKLGMLTSNIMLRCIKQLLHDGDEESLECLCKLLTTIGRDLETKHQVDLTSTFDKMRQISHRKGEVSSRVRFMLQDVIELRQGKWIPRRDDLNPKTIDQINKEAEREAVEQAMNSGPSGPRYKNEDRGGDRKKNRGPSEDGWSLAGRPKNYPVDTTRLKSKMVESDTISLGSRSLFTNWNANSKAGDTSKKSASPVISNNSFAALQDMPSEEKRASAFPSRSGGNKSAAAEKERMLGSGKSTGGDMRPHQSHLQQSRSSSREKAPRPGDDMHGGAVKLGPSGPNKEEPLRGSGVDASSLQSNVMSIDDLRKHTIVLVDEYCANMANEETVRSIEEIFGEANKGAFVSICLNEMLERSSAVRKNIAKLTCHCVSEGVVPKADFLSALSQIMSDGDDLVIDIPKVWLYFAECIVPLMDKEVITFSDFKSLEKLNEKFVAEVFQLLVKEKVPDWVKERWDCSELSWTDFVPKDKVNSFIKQHKLEFINGPSFRSQTSGSTLPIEEVQAKLVQFLKPEQDSAYTFDQVCDWIGANVGEGVSDPKFIRALMTAICESATTTVKPIKFKDDVLIEHSKFLQKYVDNKEENELQCLYAVQAFVNRLEHPQGLLCSIFHALWDNSCVSVESFCAWQKEEPGPIIGKGVAMKALTSFFTVLKEGEEDSEES